MAEGSDCRVRIAFGLMNGLAGVVLLVGVFVATQPRFWVLDVPAALIGMAQLASSVALLARLRWALRALAVAAWVSFVLGLIIVFLVVLTMLFLRGIHGDYGVAAMAVSGLVVALLVPYLLVLPALELLWLKRQRTELGS